MNVDGSQLISPSKDLVFVILIKSDEMADKMTVAEDYNLSEGLH